MDKLISYMQQNKLKVNTFEAVLNGNTTLINMQVGI